MSCSLVLLGQEPDLADQSWLFVCLSVLDSASVLGISRCAWSDAGGVGRARLHDAVSPVDYIDVACKPPTGLGRCGISCLVEVC
jgi:hypothetical protein